MVIDSKRGGSVRGYIVITAIVSIFAILVYLKERAILKCKNSSKVSDNEISITVDDNKSSKN